MIEGALVKNFSSGPISNPGQGGFFNREEQLILMNLRQDLNYHKKTLLSDILELYKVRWIKKLSFLVLFVKTYFTLLYQAILEDQ